MGHNGVLIIDKPSDWTSHDVVAKVRGILHERRVGHGGTLDPMATGVLPVFVGRATRAVELVTDGEKEYVAALRLGTVTDTQDVTGTVLATHPAPADRTGLDGVLSTFTGDILQVPPMYSALKVGGRKLYDLARKGIEVERKPRRVTIHALDLISPDEARETGLDMSQTAPADLFLRVRCSKGTYIRTLCHDIGAALGCGGCMAALRRTRVAAFALDRAVTLETLMAAEDPSALISPVEDCFDCPRVTVSGKALRLAQNGNPFPLEGPGGLCRVFDPQGQFLLLGRREGGVCTTVKSFFEPG